MYNILIFYGGGKVLSINFLLDLAVIIASTKIFGIITKRIQMPQVVGALVAGLLLGPTCFNIVHESDFISKMAELGVIFLMFGAGLETDLKELKKCGKASLIIALIGVIVPLIGGFIVAGFYNNDGSFFSVDSKKLLQNIFMGVILTATSVSITVETLQEIGKFKTPSGTAILGAAVIDDILGIVLLTIITSMSSSNVNIFFVLFKIILFFVLALGVGYIFNKIFNKLCHMHGKKRRIPLIAVVFCLVLSFVSERYFGVADITGAYIAGIVISNTPQFEYVARRVDIVSYMLLSPIFFASIGIKTEVEGLDGRIISFTIILVAIAILTKIIGCGFGAKMCGYSKDESIQIGVGMISRGEVALIVANLGASYGLMQAKYFGPIILVVVITTLITPVLLKIVYSKQDSKNAAAI